MFQLSRWPIAALAILPLGCGSAPPADEDEVIFAGWRPGVYAITASFSFQNADQTREYTDRVEFAGEVVVSVIGPLSMNTARGFCRDPEPTATQRDRERDGQMFRCPDATVQILPGSEDIRARVSMRVTEQFRIRRCEQYTTNSSGARVCARYDYIVRSRQVTKNTSVRGRQVR